MSVYIVRPKANLAERCLKLNSKPMDASSRQAQVKEVTSIWKEDTVYQDVQHWINDAQAQGRQVSKLSHNNGSAGITGTTIVRMSDEEAQQMQRDLSDLCILEDRPIELIYPIQSAGTAKPTVKKSDLWHLRAIGLEAARRKGFTGSGNGVTVAVLDTGIDSTHPELDGKVAGAYTFDLEQWQAHPMTPSQDTDGHGTHVAGLICGKQVGIAPGAKVLSGVMLPKGKGNLSDFVLAIEWAGERPDVSIVNISAGIPGYVNDIFFKETIEALQSVGVLPICAIGNEGENTTRSPGNYNSALSVGATDRRNQVTSFSGSGRMNVGNHEYTVPKIVAPGQEVYSSVLGGSYEAWNGTSMATPIVSGVASLILERYPDITTLDLREKIFSMAKVLRLPAERQGKGLVQIQAL